MALMNIRFLLSGRFHMNRMNITLTSSPRPSRLHSVSVNFLPSSGCENSHATAAMPSVMNMSRKAVGSASSRRLSSSIC